MTDKGSQPLSFFEELKRRNVIRVGIAYVVMAWLIAQITELALDTFNAPDWVMQTLLLMLALGLPVALFFAWVFELTPDGIKKEKDVGPSKSVARGARRKLDQAIIVLLSIAVVYFVVDKFALTDRMPTDATQDTNAVSTLATTAPPKSIAVLPFSNNQRTDEAQADTQFFVDGVHDDLLTQLARLGELKVISRTSVLEYRDTTKNMRQIGKELDVSTLLEGAVQRSGDRVRINVKLIDANTDAQLWAAKFDRDLTPENVFEIQTEIADAIANALATTFSDDNVDTTMAKAPTLNQQAYDFYQQARAITSENGAAELSRAIELAERAVQLDPEFALAMGEVARAYMDIYWYTSELPEHRSAAQYWLDRALAIAPDDPRLQYLLATHLYHGYLDYDAALVALDKAELGLPGDSEVHSTRGAILRRSGDFDGAFIAYDKALLLDPRNLFSLADQVYTYIAVGDVEGARRIKRRVLSFPDASDIPISFAYLGELYLLGETKPMAAFLLSRPDAELGPQAELPFLIPLLERRYEDALAILDTSPDPIVAQFGVSPHSHVRARVFYAQGRIDEAREQAERAVQELTNIAASMPDNARPFAARAMMQAILGDEKAARADARLATDLYPADRDTLQGANYVADGLRALAVFAASEELAEELDRYLALKSKMYYVDYLLLDPVFDRHRDHPAIKALQEKYTLRSDRT